MKKLACAFLLMTAFTACKNENKISDPVASIEKKAPAPIVKYGFLLNDYVVVNDTIREGDNFGDILLKHGLDHNQVFQIVEKVRDTLNPRRIKVGRPYAILKGRDSAQAPKVFVYENDVINYTVIGMGDSIWAHTAKRPVSIKKRNVSGVISSNLSNAVANAGLSDAVTHELSGIYQWSIDFFQLQKGDQFKMVFTEKYIDDTIYAGIEKIEASVFVHEEKPYYAFGFVADTAKGDRDFYDEKATPLQSFFLKAPLNFSRISSHFSPRRFHPVQKRWKAHKGTDYAAGHGTPIWSTANGVVIASSYTSGNGNYVKVKHNDTYTTQYLHMSKRAVRQGQRVKQGEIIGYVGSTGLATGPHVCYRFWKNGVQVDPFSQKLPSAEPIKAGLRDTYFAAIEPLKAELEKIEFKNI